MILPGMTISPPNFLTPSRLPRLSRPLRDEPPAFLCAICCSFRGTRAGCASDFRDSQHRLLLAVTFLAPVIVPPFLLEDDDLGRSHLLDNGGGTGRAVKGGLPDVVLGPQPKGGDRPRRRWRGPPIAGPVAGGLARSAVSNQISMAECTRPNSIFANGSSRIWAVGWELPPPKGRQAKHR